MKVVSLLFLLNLASTEAAPKDYDGVVSNLRKVADGIDAKKNVLSKKLENIRMMKTQLQELEDSIRKDEKEMDSEKKGIAEAAWNGSKTFAGPGFCRDGQH